MEAAAMEGDALAKEEEKLEGQEHHADNASGEAAVDAARMETGAAAEGNDGGGGSTGGGAQLVQPTLFSYIANDLVWARAGGTKGNDPFWPVRCHPTSKTFPLAPCFFFAILSSPLLSPTKTRRRRRRLEGGFPAHSRREKRAPSPQNQDALHTRGKRNPPPHHPLRSAKKQDTNAVCSHQFCLVFWFFLDSNAKKKMCIPTPPPPNATTAEQGRMIDVMEAPEGVRRECIPNSMCVQFYGPSSSKTRDRDYCWAGEQQLAPFGRGCSLKVVCSLSFSLSVSLLSSLSLSLLSFSLSVSLFSLCLSLPPPPPPPPTS
jgi:hypothetical protein